MKKFIFFIIILFTVFILFKNSIVGAVVDSKNFEGNISKFEQSNYSFWVGVYTLKDKIVQQVKDGISYRNKNPLVKKSTLDETFDKTIQPQKINNIFGIPSDEKINEIFN